MSDLETKQTSSGICGVDSISYWRAYNEFCPNCGVEFSKMHPMANLIPHYYGECTKNKQLPPKSPNQQILEAIAALAEGIRARDKQWDAVSEQIRLGFEALTARMETLYFLQPQITSTYPARNFAALTATEVRAQQILQKAQRAKKRKR